MLISALLTVVKTTTTTTTTKNENNKRKLVKQIMTYSYEGLLCGYFKVILERKCNAMGKCDVLRLENYENTRLQLLGEGE